MASSLLVAVFGPLYVVKAWNQHILTKEKLWVTTHWPFQDGGHDQPNVGDYLHS